MLFGIDGWEFVVLIVVALLVIGPDRMPEYSAKLARLVRQVKTMADTAKVQLREQMGPDFDDVDWKQYDPRQYDPRRIVREALLDEGTDDDRQSSATGEASAAGDASSAGDGGGFKKSSSASGHDPHAPTPYDEDAT